MSDGRSESEANQLNSPLIKEHIDILEAETEATEVAEVSTSKSKNQDITNERPLSRKTQQQFNADAKKLYNLSKGVQSVTKIL